MRLFDWQRPIADRVHHAVSTLGSCFLVSAPGSGKTYIGTDTALKLARKTLILCPKSALGVWERVLNEAELGEMSSCLNFEQLTNTRTKLVKEKTLGRWRNKIFEWSLDPNQWFVIIDEGHRCCSKGGKSRASGLYVGLKKAGIPHLMTTATPPDDPMKMKALGYSLGLFELSQFWTWCMMHGVRKSYVHKGFEFDRKTATENLIRISDAMDKSGGFVHVPMEDVMKFYPEGHCYMEPVKVDEKKEAQIRKLYADDFEKLDRMIEEAEYKLVEDLRVHQATEMLKVPFFKESANDLREQGFSPVIFVNFRATAEKLCKELKTDSLIIGEQSKATRCRVIEDFQSNDSDIVIVTSAAGGEAISLHDLDGKHPRVSLMSPVWSPVSLKQILGRIHRTGGKSPVTQKILVLPGIEERIYERVMQRTNHMAIISRDDHKIVKENTP